MIGYFAAFGCTAFMTAKDLLSKKLSFQVSGAVSAFASFAYALPFYAVLLTTLHFMGVEDFSFSKKFLFFAFLRSVTDVCAETLKMLSLTHGEISFASQFFALSPIFLAITSPLITKDPITLPIAISLVLVTISSLILVYKPRGQKLGPKEKKTILYGLSAAFFFSLNSALDRLAVQEASATLSGFTMTLFSFFILLPISFFSSTKTWGKQLGNNARGFFARGFLEVFFMVLKMLSLQHLQAPIVAIIQRFSVIFTIIGGKVIYKEKDFKKRLLAGGLVVASGVLIFIF